MQYADPLAERAYRRTLLQMFIRSEALFQRYLLGFCVLMIVQALVWPERSRNSMLCLLPALTGLIFGMKLAGMEDVDRALFLTGRYECISMLLLQIGVFVDLSFLQPHGPREACRWTPKDDQNLCFMSALFFAYSAHLVLPWYWASIASQHHLVRLSAVVVQHSLTFIQSRFVPNDDCRNIVGDTHRPPSVAMVMYLIFPVPLGHLWAMSREHRRR